MDLILSGLHVAGAGNRGCPRLRQSVYVDPLRCDRDLDDNLDDDSPDDEGDLDDDERCAECGARFDEEHAFDCSRYGDEDEDDGLGDGV